VDELTWRFGKKVRSLPDEQQPAGPWDDEPDKIQWIDQATGLDCLIVRNGGGALCGYVGLPPEHPLYGYGYDRAYEEAEARGVELFVHGGLTFADRCAPGEPIEGICHLGEHGATEEPWWLGFDTAHAGDLSPLDEAMQQLPGWPRRPASYGKYRDVEYVKFECARLAEQLARVQ